MGASAGKAGGVFTSTTGSTVTFTNEATTADAAKLRYSITNRVKSAWPLAESFTVKKDGTTVTTGFTIEHAAGSILFDAALTTEVVTVSGKYQPVSEVGGFYQWKADQSVATAETTDFTAARSGWETYMSLGVLNAKITAARHWDTAGFRQRVGTPVLVRCYVSVATGEQYTAWAIPASSGADSDRDKVVDEPIAFALIGPLHYRSSN